MASKYLGSAFDIHGGGLDLVFPHHENELAQSCAAGDAFATYWMHNAWVTASGEKMSKSLGNSLLVSEVVQRVRPIELRYYLGSAHYRSMIEFSFEALEESAIGFRRIESFIRRALQVVGDGGATDVPQAFRDAMNDDLGVPQALAVLHDTVREGNAALDAGDDARVRELLASVRAMVSVLGVDPLAAHWGGSDDTAARLTIDRLVAGLLDERAAARTRKDFTAADAIRDRLADAGVVIEDTPAGPRWSVGGV
jgi:cysteinyl-tRNA synthetase